MPDSANSTQPLRLAGYQGEASILTASLRRLAGLLRTSDAQWPVELEIDVTRSGEKAAELFASVEQGRRQVAYMASSYLSARVPELAVLDLPFPHADRAAALRALDGEAGMLLREAVARRTGLRVLGFWDNGFRHLSNAVRPLRRPADCAGLTIRTLDSAQYRALLEALGFRPVSLDVKELVRAVQTGAVQAQENPLTNLLSFGLAQWHRHVSLTGHLFGVLLLVCPRDWFEALPAARRAALQQAVDAATALQRELAAGEDRTALTQLRAQGVEVLDPEDLDLAAFRAAAGPLSTRLRQAVPRALLDAYLPDTTCTP